MITSLLTGGKGLKGMHRTEAAGEALLRPKLSMDLSHTLSLFFASSRLTNLERYKAYSLYCPNNILILLTIIEVGSSACFCSLILCRSSYLGLPEENKSEHYVRS